jgi:hypothetical protein
MTNGMMARLLAHSCRNVAELTATEKGFQFIGL